MRREDIEHDESILEEKEEEKEEERDRETGREESEEASLWNGSKKEWKEGCIEEACNSQRGVNWFIKHESFSFSFLCLSPCPSQFIVCHSLSFPPFLLPLCSFRRIGAFCKTKDSTCQRDDMHRELFLAQAWWGKGKKGTTSFTTKTKRSHPSFSAPSQLILHSVRDFALFQQQQHIIPGRERKEWVKGRGRFGWETRTFTSHGYSGKETDCSHNQNE